MLADDILTEDHLCNLSGNRTREGLRAWLDQNKIPYLLARSGWPRVHRKALEAAMGVGGAADAGLAKPVEFNFAALNA
jgi:hypothetical protein